jgi:hypothetical protein
MQRNGLSTGPGEENKMRSENFPNVQSMDNDHYQLNQYNEEKIDSKNTTKLKALINSKLYAKTKLDAPTTSVDNIHVVPDHKKETNFGGVHYVVEFQLKLS